MPDKGLFSLALEHMSTVVISYRKQDSIIDQDRRFFSYSIVSTACMGKTGFKNVQVWRHFKASGLQVVWFSARSLGGVRESG